MFDLYLFVITDRKNQLIFYYFLLSWYQYPLMSCCAKEHVVKKKPMEPVYAATPVVHKQVSSQLYPRGFELRSGAKPVSEEEVKVKKQQLKKISSEVVRDEGEFKTIKEAMTKEKAMKLKKMKRCGYDINELDKKYKGTKDKFDDLDFNYEDLEMSNTKAVWKRPQEFIKQPELFPDEITPNDIVQGKLNDCYFLSACASLAEKPYRIYELFTTREYNPNGYYICKLNFNGIYQEVIVDDLFPVQVETNQALCAKPAQGKYIWAMILEKCWAKFLKGYSNCHFGYTNEAFQCLTGAPTKAYILKQYKPIDPDFNNLFKHLKQSDQKNYAIQITRDAAKTARENYDAAMEEGLPMGHAYSLIGVYFTKLKNGQNVKLMQVRNPWAKFDSKLAWNDNDPRWDLVYPQEKERMQYRFNKGDNDGVFYMQWQTFTQKFDNLFSVCEINDEANYTYIPIEAYDRKPVYFQVQTDGQPEDIGIYFVQQMQQHFKDQYNYSGVSAVISKVMFNEKGQRQGYELIRTTNYYNSKLDNYFTLPIRKAKKGVYLLRLYIWWPEVSKGKKQNIVAGLYSAANFGIKEVTNQISDVDFIQQNCRSHARQNKNRVQVEGDPYSWWAKSMMEDANYGYFIFHFGQKSEVNQYRLKFDQKQNTSLYFLLHFRDKSQFEIDCEKGCEYIVLYAWKPQYDQAMDKHLFPTYDPKFRLPEPEIIKF